MRKVVALALVIFLPPVAAVDLIQVYDMALENDPQLHAAKSTRDSTAEAKPQAIAKMLPKVSGSGTATRTERDTPTANYEYDSTELTATLTQPLLHFEYWMSLSKARYTTAKADADYSAAELNLILRVAQAYFNILSSQDSLKFAESERKAISRQLDQAKQRFDVGLIAVTDVHEAQAAFDQSRANEITAQNVNKFLKVNPGLPTSEHIVAMRFDGQLYFANVAFFEDTVLEAVADHPKAKYLLIVGDGINQLDASGEEVVHHLVKRLRGIGVELVFSGLKKQVLDIMRSTHLFDLIGQRNLFPTEDKAITAIYERLGDEAAEDLFCPVRQTAQ